MNKKTRKIIIIVAVVIVVVLGGLILLDNIGGDPNEIVIENVAVDDVADGTYKGEYVTTLVSAELEVTVLDGKLTDIDIIMQGCGPGYDAREILDSVLTTQSLDVDTISGATMSSKVLLKSIELALNEGR